MEKIDVRGIEGSDVLERINCADLAQRYFHRSRSWLAQRLNNNQVNGRPATFTPAELATLRTALHSLARDLDAFAARLER